MKWGRLPRERLSAVALLHVVDTPHRCAQLQHLVADTILDHNI